MKLKHGPYSPSRLDTGICGFSFYNQYVRPDRIKSKENLPQARGSAVHEAFEEVTKKMIENPSYVFSHEEIRGWVSDAINRHPAAYEEIDAITTMVKEYIRRPPKILTKDAGVEMKLAIKWDGVSMYEDNINGKIFKRPVFEECDYNDPDAFARGRADILLISEDATRAIIYDHKTQPNMEEADTFQMGFYAWVISRYYPFLEEISTIMHFARYAYYSDAYVWSKEQLVEVESQIMDRVYNIEHRASWDAVPNNKCQYCPFITKCPAVAEFIEVDEAGSARTKTESYKIYNDVHKAVKIAGLINVLEDSLSMAKEELRTYVKNSNCGIAIPGKVYEFRKNDTNIDWDKVNKMREKVFSVFVKHKVDPTSFMGFSQTHSKHIWMTENEALVKELAEMFPRKLETTFKGWKL